MKDLPLVRQGQKPTRKLGLAVNTRPEASSHLLVIVAEQNRRRRPDLAKGRGCAGRHHAKQSCFEALVVDVGMVCDQDVFCMGSTFTIIETQQDRLVRFRGRREAASKLKVLQEFHNCRFESSIAAFGFAKHAPTHTSSSATVAGKPSKGAEGNALQSRHL